jgi:hypothetical protein
MATYLELYELRSDEVLLSKVLVACIISAEIIRTNGDTGTPWDAANHASRLIWARKVFADPNTESTRMYYCILASNRAVSKTVIQSATDTIIQEQVNSHVDLFAL